jgi:hypothetical protein
MYELYKRGLFSLIEIFFQLCVGARRVSPFNLEVRENYTGLTGKSLQRRVYENVPNPGYIYSTFVSALRERH